MFVDVLYAWLVVRLAVSLGLGARAANRLRHDESSRRAFAWVGRLHVIGAGVTWLLEALVRVEERPIAGLLPKLLALPIMLLWTCWVPVTDAFAFGAVTALIAVLLVRRRLARYRDELILGEPEQRVRAAQACEFLGRLAEPALPELVEVTSDPDPELRYRAVRAIGAVRPRDPATVSDTLRRALRDSDPRVRMAAGCSLTTLGAADPAAVLPEVAAALRSGDEDLQAVAVKAAEALSFNAVPLVELLAGLAGHWKLGQAAIQALRTIGEPAIPVLTKLSEDADPTVQQAAIGALGHIEIMVAEEQAATLKDAPTGEPDDRE
jgi:HEAT repeats